jgi:hypothetical protein
LETVKICAVLVGLAPDERAADEYLNFTRLCPYVAAAMATGLTVMALYVLPESKRWWIDTPAEHPELLGLLKAEVNHVDDSLASSPWSRGEIVKDQDLPPCGSNCGTCPFFQGKCSGCPASRFSCENGHSQPE